MRTVLPKFKHTPSPPLTHIDIKKGDMNFGQRIELGKIISTESSELEKFEKVFVCLHEFKPEPKEYESLLVYFGEIIEGLKHWIELEAVMLKYEASEDEKKAGVKELSEKIGEFG